MIVKCIANTGENLSQIMFDLGYNKDYKFDIEIGKIYVVYGASMWKGSLEYLIAEKSTNTPIWCPAELFNVIHKTLSIFWHFNFEKYKNYNGHDSEKAFWGYKELVEDADHYEGLLMKNINALEIFKKRKAQYDEYEGLNFIT